MDPDQDKHKQHGEISEERKALYYVGIAISAIGFLLFISVFFSAACHFGDFHNFEARGQSMGIRAITGMLLVVIGMVMGVVGRMGLAGSGLKLDPDQGREDLKPWSKMAGGMVNDALEEMDDVQITVGCSDSEQASVPREVIRVRCPHCRALNDEDAHFCDQCGQEL